MCCENATPCTNGLTHIKFFAIVMKTKILNLHSRVNMIFTRKLMNNIFKEIVKLKIYKILKKRNAILINYRPLSIPYITVTVVTTQSFKQRPQHSVMYGVSIIGYQSIFLLMLR